MGQKGILLKRMIYSLRTRLFILLVVILAGVVLIGRWFLQPMMRTQTRKYLAISQDKMSEGLAGTLQIHYLQSSRAIEALARELEPFDPQTGRDPITRQIDFCGKVSPLFEYFFILDASGRWISYPDRPDLVGESIPDENRGWLERTIREDKPVYVGVLRARTGVLVSGFAVPLHNSAGEPVAVLRGVIILSRENTAEAIVKNLSVLDGGQAYIVDEKGWLLAHPEKTFDYQDFDIIDWSGQEPVRKALAGNREMTLYTCEGIRYMATSAPVKETGWHIVVQMPMQEIRRRINENFKILLIISAVGALIILVLILTAFQVSVSPLFSLADAIRENKMDQLIANHRRDEIGTVSRELVKLYKGILTQNRELEEARRQAEESDRLKSAFLANISHEIRTPMNGILGFADLLRDPELGKQDREEYLNVILSSGQRMLGIINDLINISRIEAGETVITKSLVDPYPLIDGLVLFFRPEADKRGITLNREVPGRETPCQIWTDQEKLHQILTNLVKNALKFTPQGTVTVGCFAEGNGITFFVRDTGVGISAEEREQIFMRFHQGRNTGNDNLDGAGLGLAISKGYAELLGGTLTLISEPGRGSEFRLFLPPETPEHPSDT